jgi:hypothetical protein
VQIKPEQMREMLRMIVECGMQERTYMKYYGVLAERYVHMCVNMYVCEHMYVYVCVCVNMYAYVMCMQERV